MGIVGNFLGKKDSDSDSRTRGGADNDTTRGPHRVARVRDLDPVETACSRGADRSRPAAVAGGRNPRSRTAGSIRGAGLAQRESCFENGAVVSNDSKPSEPGDHPQTPTPIIRAGENCWRMAHAGRTAFLVDGDAYYRALRAALLNAREQVIVLGWDIDGRLELARDDPHGEAPSVLRELLNYVIERRSELRIHVLLWDFAVLYALEREPLPSINLGLRTAHGIEVALDNTAPIGGSRHDKIVVIDDELAFCGGLDLTDARWDTPAHDLDDARRVRSNGKPYDPFHDIQMAVDDEAAAALGEHCRTRWELVTGVALRRPRGGSNPWPEVLDVDLRDVAVAISRTQPATDSDTGVREVERLYVDAIESARRYVYIENQYFTANSVANAIAARLREQDGPEFVLVGPDSCDGWLEQNTMGLLRREFVDKLRESDRFGRLGVFSPLLDEDTGANLMVHAKLFISDDRFLRIGSSNLTNRSMGLDSECDLAIEAVAGSEHASESIRGLRNRLLAEHLGADADEIDARIAECGSVLDAIADYAKSPRRLERCAIDEEESETPTALVAAIGDPAHPIESEATIEEFRDKVSTGVARYAGALGLLALGVLVVGLALLWQYTSLAEHVSIDATRAWIERVRSSGFLVPVLLLVTYVVGGLVAFPVMALNAATAIAFGPWLGFTYALAGSMASAIATFGIGKRLGSGAMRRFSSGIVYQASRAISDRGFLAVLSCRLIPVAPFTVINLVAGALPIRFADYLMATLLGMVPGIAVLAAFGYQIERVLESPSAGNVVLLGVLVAIWIALGFVFNRLLRRMRPRRRAMTDTLER